MSAFKVGDLVLIVGGDDVGNHRHKAVIGMQSTVTEINAHSSERGGLIRVALRHPAYNEGLLFCPHHLRKIDPKDDAEPLLDHLPCDPEFTEDLSRWMENPVKS